MRLWSLCWHFSTYCNSKSKSELLRFKDGWEYKGMPQGSEFSGSSVKKGEKKFGKCSKHSVHVVSHSVVLSLQPTGLEQKSVSVITTDTAELSNKRSPPKEQDAAEDWVPAQGNRTITQEHKDPEYLLAASEWTAKGPRTVLRDKKVPALCFRWCWEAPATSPATWGWLQAVGTPHCREQGCGSDLEADGGPLEVVQTQRTHVEGS